ncbi:NAD(P)-dependent oxidoreductase [Paraburkholderia sp. UYCP14C]|uniref:NAD-dependent epimerase/dehydratase family protein n=1 Tax=Paraburkholderia sp. UYCP14C TaxID=2511130 RepID=UPI00145A0119|nr:NAD(P)-dependent oxidoreductase [Paraburkholderia sp. UYCP14C]
MTSAKRVLVTGSTGNLGAKAVAALKTLENVEVIGIGRNSTGDPNVITADLERYDRSWARQFEGVDAVLHLAADPKPVGSWDSITRLNIELALNVFRAAEEARLRRFVFASSNWVLGGYRFRDERLTSGLSPLPVNPYGASKLFVERYGLAAAARTGMSVISLRIGYCQPGDNLPGPHMAFGRWGQEMWLGNDDWAQAVIRSVSSPFEGSAVLNIVSRNHGSRWDLEEAKETIGYDPVQSHRPTLTATNLMKDRGAGLRERLIPMGATVPLFGSRW